MVKSINPYTLTDNYGYIVCPNCRRNIKSLDGCPYCGYSESQIQQLIQGNNQ